MQSLKQKETMVVGQCTLHRIKVLWPYSGWLADSIETVFDPHVFGVLECYAPLRKLNKIMIDDPEMPGTSITQCREYGLRRMLNVIYVMLALWGAHLCCLGTLFLLVSSVAVAYEPRPWVAYLNPRQFLEYGLGGNDCHWFCCDEMIMYHIFNFRYELCFNF